MADEHVDLVEDEESEDEYEQTYSFNFRAWLCAKRVVDMSVNILMACVHDYPANFLGMSCKFATEIAGLGPWPGAFQTVSRVGFVRMYDNWAPWAASFFLRRFVSKVPGFVETLTGKPLPLWPRRALRLVNAGLAVIPIVTFEQMWVRRMLALPVRVAGETIDRTGVFGIPWWAVGLRAIDEAVASRVDHDLMWRYMLPASHPSMDRRGLVASILATPLYMPRLFLLPLYRFPLPDYNWDMRSLWALVQALVAGAVIGACIGLPLNLLYQFLRPRLFGMEYEDAEVRLERKLLHAETHEAKVRGRVDTTPQLLPLKRQPTVALKEAAAANLKHKTSALRFRISKFATRVSAFGSKIEALVVDRSNLLASLEGVAMLPARSLLTGKVKVKFQHEPGLDAGGVMREYLHEVGQALSHSSLLSPGPDAAFLPSKQDQENKQAWQRDMFAIGRLMALAIIVNAPLDLALSSCVYKVLLGEQITMSDVARLDPQFAELRIVNLLKPGGVTAVEEMLGDHLTFVGTNEEELIDGGKDVRVTERNKQQYVRLLVEHYLVGRCRSELAVLVEGFHDVIPKSVLKTSPPLRALDLELMVAGLPGIDIVDWRAHTEGDLMTQEKHKDLREWFWQYVDAMSMESRAKLLSFACGSTRVPAGGFSNLNPQFNVAVEGDPSRLPSAHTCINQLVLPPYTERQQLEKMLDKALEYNTGFGFM